MIADCSYILRFFEGSGVFVILVSSFHVACPRRFQPGDTPHVG